jgi:hypothetical protein
MYGDIASAGDGAASAGDGAASVGLRSRAAGRWALVAAAASTTRTRARQALVGRSIAIRLSRFSQTNNGAVGRGGGRGASLKMQSKLIL